MRNDSSNEELPRANQGYVERVVRRSNANKILILRIYSIFGLFATVAGIAFALLSAFDLSAEVKMGLLVSVSGAFLFAASKFMIGFIREVEVNLEKTESVDISQIRLLRQWAEFEKQARDAIGLEPKSSKDLSIRNTINALRSVQYLSDEDYAIIQEALEFRNLVAHGLATKASLAEIDMVSSALKRVSEKLSLKPEPPHANR